MCVMIQLMSTELEAAARAFHRAEDALKRRREALASAIVQASRDGVRQADIVRTLDEEARRAGQKRGGYSREHVRRIVDAADKRGGEHDEARSPGEAESGPVDG